MKNLRKMMGNEENHTDRKKRIYEEILIDCNGEYEENMSWFYYMEEKLVFPFKAEIMVKKQSGKVENEKVKVLEFTSEEAFDEGFDLLVGVALGNRIIDVPILKLKNVKAGRETSQAIEDWKFWKSHRD